MTQFVTAGRVTAICWHSHLLAHLRINEHELARVRVAVDCRLDRLPVQLILGRGFLRRGASGLDED